jgi:hypothetical protein
VLASAVSGPQADQCGRCLIIHGVKKQMIGYGIPDGLSDTQNCFAPHWILKLYQQMNIFAVNAKDPALQRNFKSISKGSRTRLAGVMAKNALWSLTTGRNLSCFFAIGRTQ